MKREALWLLATMALLAPSLADAKRRPKPQPHPEVLTAEAGATVRARRCFGADLGFIYVRECPTAFLGTGRLRWRPTGPLLVRAHAALGFRHLRNTAWVHLFAEEPLDGKFPTTAIEFDLQVGAGLSGGGPLTEARIWAGPRLEVGGTTPETQSRLEALDLGFSALSVLSLGGELHGGVVLTIPGALRLGFDFGLAVLGDAAFEWTDEVSVDPERREELTRLYRDTTIRTMFSVDVATPAEGPVGFFDELGVATGFIVPSAETQALYADLGIDSADWFHAWPEFRFLIGVQLRRPRQS
ncbi:MAG: hypothetical protein GY898_05125 [Proteobacteria bacterium]|nr:hypothetical protein [Pseudomonadota bacterium]